MPTPRLNPLDDILSLHARPDNPQNEAPLSYRGSSDSGNPQQSRSRSHTERLEGLQFSQMPVDARAWLSGRMPEELKEYVKDMEAIARGVEVIPLEVKDKFATTQENILDFQ